MHNLHYIIVNAEDGEQACSKADSEILEWGNENNWRSFGGAVSQDDELYVANEGRWNPNAEETKIADINKSIQSIIDKTLDYKDDYGEDIKPTLEKLNSGDLGSRGKFDLDLYRFKKWVDALSTVPREKDGKPSKFDILSGHEFLDWKFDEYGVTNMAYEKPEKDEKKWVVFVDMHS